MLFASLKRILTLTCEESTRLVSESLDRELPAGERWAVRLHALCCWSCRRYRRQILFLRDAIRRRAIDIGAAAPPAGPTLSPEARQRIQQALARHDSQEH